MLNMQGHENIGGQKANTKPLGTLKVALIITKQITNFEKNNRHVRSALMRILASQAIICRASFMRVKFVGRIHEETQKLIFPCWGSIEQLQIDPRYANIVVNHQLLRKAQSITIEAGEALTSYRTFVNHILHNGVHTKLLSMNENMCLPNTISR